MMRGNIKLQTWTTSPNNSKEITGQPSLVLQSQRPFLNELRVGERNYLVRLNTRLRASGPGMFWTGSWWSKECIQRPFDINFLSVIIADSITRTLV